MQHSPARSRRRLAAAAFTIGGALLAVGAFAPTAQAGEDPPAVYGAGYDSYLNANQRGFGPDDVNPGECPTDESVDGLTAWHFILGGNTHEFAELSVAFTIEGTDVELANLTPKTTAEWDTFDPALNFMADPHGGHAYVYTDGSGVVRDAAAQDDPDSAGPKFQLSHVCVGEGGGTTDGTDEPTTDGEEPTTDGEEPTTDGPDVGAGSLGSTDDPAPEEGPAVEGTVETLPRTGSEDQSLFLLGIGFIAAGTIALVMKRELFIRS